ncbi:hypothetical protein XELAEV_18024806mg [Xenopus laevis]|uniref:Uncharacterized protein n=1 Tax=Xenopus laevis TaxID=8355 RepID=A0A974D0Q3_XENLA|nr:hypothetical protein XELAEV_18024806mg [Xenopus laevis]
MQQLLCILKTDLPPFYAILALNLSRKKQMISNSLLVESQKRSLQWSLQLVQPAILELQTPLWSNSKLAPLDKLPTPKEQTYSLPNSQWLIYHKVRAALYRLNKSKHQQFGTSSIMELLISENYRHSITHFYKELQNLILRKNSIKARAQWEHSIDFITDDQWTQALSSHSKWYILGMDPPNQLTRPAKKILHKILFQALRLIAQLWKSQLPPLYADLEKSVQCMCNMEQLIARRNNNSDQCIKIWQLWILENV